jgi:hypothetical protein
VTPSKRIMTAVPFWLNARAFMRREHAVRKRCVFRVYLVRTTPARRGDTIRGVQSERSENLSLHLAGRCLA